MEEEVRQRRENFQLAVGVMTAWLEARDNPTRGAHLLPDLIHAYASDAQLESVVAGLTSLCVGLLLSLESMSGIEAPLLLQQLSEVLDPDSPF